MGSCFQETYKLNRFMKSITLTIYLLLLSAALLWLIACERKSNPIPAPVTPPVSSTTAASSTTAVSSTTANELTLKAFRIDGVPNENVAIDQVNKQIIVTLPDGYSLAQLKGIGQFGCSNCGFTTGRGPDSIVTMGWCYAQSGTSFRLIRKSPAPLSEYVDYKLVAVAGGPLKLGPFPEYIIGKSWGSSIPVTNYFETGTFSRGYLYHLATGQLIDSTAIYCGRFDGVNDKLPNVISVGVDLDLPGDYRFDLVKTNGRRASTLFTVQKGVPKVSGNVVVKSQAEVSFRLGGYNLYREDNIEVWLRQPRGYSARLKPTDYTVRGRTVTLKLPTDCPLGYYYVQATRNNQEFPLPAWDNIDFVVTENARQPLLYSDLLYGPSGETLKKVKPRDDISVYIPMTSDYSANPRVEYVFTDITDSKRQIVAEATYPSGYFMGFTEGTGVRVTIPFDTPPGRYRITPRRIMANGEVINGITHPRIYEVMP